MKTMLPGYETYYHFKGHYIVSSGQSIIILKIYFMLSRSHLMVGGLNFKAHLFKNQAHIPAGILSSVHRAQIKIPSIIMGSHGGFTFRISVEEEKLCLRPGLHGIAHFFRFLQYPL